MTQPVLQLVPMAIKEAQRLVLRWHSHSPPAHEHRAALGVRVAGSDEPCGALIIGEPVAQEWRGSGIAELVRVVTDKTPNAASCLYGAGRRLAAALGFATVVSYTLERESGACLKAAGFTRVAGERGGGSWSRQSRPRPEQGALFDGCVVVADQGPKVLWAALNLDRFRCREEGCGLIGDRCLGHVAGSLPEAAERASGSVPA